MKATEVIDSLARHMLVDGFHLVMDLQKSKGSWLVDARYGKQYLDFYSFFSSAPLGHNHPRLVEPAFQKRLGALAAHKPANSDIYTVEYAQWVEAFATHAELPDLPHLFWIDGGALAVENALKTAFDWKVRKNLAQGLPPKGSKVIHFQEAFHGRSGYTLSLTNTFDPRKYLHFPKFDWPRISNPKLSFPMDEPAIERAEAEAVAQIEAAVSQDPNDIACLIIEPIQGEGGDNHFRGAFLRKLRQLADELDFLLIFDEIQTGFGTTGRWWAHQHWDVRPDILVFGKKVQTCGIAVSKRIDEIPDNVFHVPSRINSTWGGNLVDMVRATRILEVICEENLIEHCAQQGQRLLKGLQSLHEEFEDFTSNPRGLGMFAALDLCTSELRDEVLQQAHELGLLCLASGEKGLRLRPALNLPPWDLDLGLELLRKSLQSVAPTRPGRLKQ